MSTHLRRGLDQLKEFYIRRLLSLGQFSETELASLTVSELDHLYKNSILPAKCSKDFFQKNKTF
ncbi:Fur-regulated basic protein FbpA [Neobacillus muris]|uniref:Fur-regulated basic protein FbpA n=1 Tax=Neobacillus muris TaxID=2941334 RepID=UPI00203CB3CC|nr:Fur-regulated basic protein FbpA [Neobacillus muris]